MKNIKLKLARVRKPLHPWEDNKLRTRPLLATKTGDYYAPFLESME